MIFLETFGYGFSIWSDDLKYNIQRASWNESHIPILRSSENYRKRKFSIFEPLDVVVDEKILNNYRCPNCFALFTTLQNMQRHKKCCDKGQLYKYEEKKYGDQKTIRQQLLDEDILDPNDTYFTNLVSFDIEAVNVLHGFQDIISVC